MKQRRRKWIYILIPFVLIIKLMLIALLLNLPEGCKQKDDLGLKDTEVNNHNVVIVSLIQGI